MFERLDKHNIKEIKADLEAVKKVVCSELQKMGNEKHRNNGHIRTKSEFHSKRPSINTKGLEINVEQNEKIPTGAALRLNLRRSTNYMSGKIVKFEEIENIIAAKQQNEGSTKGSTGQKEEQEFEPEKTKDEENEEKKQIIRKNYEFVKMHKAIPPTNVENYKFIKLIGKGAFGKVALGMDKLTGKYVAIKTIEKSYMKDEASKKKVFREVYILKKIRHPNVIRLLEVFESNMHLLIVMEYAAGGDLLKYIKKKKKLSESEARKIFRQIVHGLGYIHTRSVLHRDIKPDNILLDFENKVKICDFGVSKIVDRDTIIKEQCGTPAYIAPEIISDRGYKGYFVDHWSLGVLLFTMLNGVVPFKSTSMKELHMLIKNRLFSYQVDISDGIFFIMFIKMPKRC